MREIKSLIVIVALLAMAQPCCAEGSEPPAGEVASSQHGADEPTTATSEDASQGHGSTEVAAPEESSVEPMPESHDSADSSAAEGVAAEETIVRPEPDDREKELIASIKMLFSAQDAAAAGHGEAKELQSSMHAMILSRDYSAKRMSGSKHLADYLAGYLLSGGDAHLVNLLIGSSHFDEQSTKLLQGCIAYRLGKRDDAKAALAEVDLAALSPPVVGRVALARAVLTDGKVARERLFAIAIASMPGTLVEEGALRRSALAYSEAGDRDNFWKRVDRYTRRFPHSGYLPDFIQQVASAAARLAQDDRHIDAAKMDGSLSRLPTNERSKVYIALARLGSSRHMVELIDYAARRLGRIATPGSQEEQVAEIYNNAYRLLNDGETGPRQVLKSLDPTNLPEQEKKLLSAALTISDEIEAPLDSVSVAEAPPTTPLTARAAAALKSADELLQEPM